MDKYQIPEKGKRAVSRIFALLIGLAMVTSARGALFADDTADQITRGIKTLEELQSAFHMIARKVVPAVVEIRVVNVIDMGDSRLPFQFNFDDGDGDGSGTNRFRQSGLGSGVIVERRGNKAYVLTNDHVVGNASEITVRLSDDREFKAQIVGTDPNRDLALVLFETGEAVPIAELGDSDTVAAGDWVLAIGNPYGFSSTITVGIVSAVGRETGGTDFTDYIQTDAAINQGNSGGALVNIRGQVIGINSWIASPSGGSVGIGFAIPINNAKKDITDFLTKGRVEYGWLGVAIGDPSKALAGEMLLEGKQGAFVSSVFVASPADKAGLKPGDFVTAVDGKAVRNSSELLNIIGNLAPGKAARFTVIRGGKETTVTATLAVRADKKTIEEARL